MTTAGATALPDFSFQEGDVLLLGAESSGVPAHVHGRRGGAGRAYPDAAGFSVLECRGRGWHRAGRGTPADERLAS